MTAIKTLRSRARRPQLRTFKSPCHLFDTLTGVNYEIYLHTLIWRFGMRLTTEWAQEVGTWGKSFTSFYLAI